MDKGNIIYLDNGASTRVRASVLKEMMPYFREKYGNASSPHSYGELARNAINRARTTISNEIGARPFEIVFTSGGTEANNLALFGLAHSAFGRKRKKIIISSIEHSSIIEPCEVLRNEGFELIEVPVNREGLVNFDILERIVDSQTLLVSIIHANNEIGVVQDIARIGALCKSREVLFHTDAVQSLAKIEIDVRRMHIDLLSACAHKIGGPKGVGILYFREGLSLTPMIYGGGQERGTRGGTENVVSIVGFSAALNSERKIKDKPIKKLGEYFMSELENIGGKINGSREHRLYNNVNVTFDGKDSELLIAQLSQKKIMSSDKSACLSKQKKEGRVLNALGLSDSEIRGSLRFVLSEETSKKDIDRTLSIIKKIIS